MQQQETISENKKFINERNDKQNEITMRLIAQTSLNADSQQNSTEDEKINVIIRLKSIHLQWLNIKKIQNLQVFEDLTVLYLQHNLIATIQGLSHLKNLQYLALNDNRITIVDNLKDLKKLLGLNLNNNDIQEIDQNQLPENLQVLSIKNNPVCLDVDYKSKILAKLKYLEMFDDKSITPTERFKTLGIFPQKLLTYANHLKQFYTKRQLKSKLQEDSKPVLFNTETINQKQAQGEIRQKTRKYIYQNQESFKTDLKEQIQNYNQKIEVSKKIRSIKESQEKERQIRLKEIKQSTMDQLMNNYSKK